MAVELVRALDAEARVREIFEGGERGLGVAVGQEPAARWLLLVRGAELHLARAQDLLPVARLIPDGGRLLAVAGTEGSFAVASESGSVMLYSTEAVREALEEQRQAQEEEADEEPLHVAAWATIRCRLPAIMAWDATGALLAVGTSDGVVRVWEARASAPFQTHELRAGPTTPVRALLWLPRPWAPKRMELNVAYQDEAVRVWALESSKAPRLTLTGHAAPPDALACPDEWTLVSSGRDRVLLVWDTKRGTLLRTVPTFEAVHALVPQGAGRVQSVGEGGRVREWNVVTGQELHPEQVLRHPAVPTGPLTALLKDEDGAQVLTAAAGQVVRQTLEGGWRLSLGALGDLGDVCVPTWAPDLAVLAGGAAPRLWQLGSGAWWPPAAEEEGGPILAVAAHPKERMVASVGRDGALTLWAVPATMEDGPLRRLARTRAHVGALAAVVWSRSAVVTGAADGTVQRWAWREGVLVLEAAAKAHSKECNALALAPDGKTLASGGHDRLVRLWSLEGAGELRALRTLSGHKRAVWSVSWAPHEQLLASTSGDGTIRLWSAAGACLRVLEAAAPVLRCLFLPLGLQLVTGDAQGRLQVWTLRSGEAELVKAAHSDKLWGLALALHPGAPLALVSVAADGTLVLWRDATKRQVAAETEKARQEQAAQQRLSNLLRDGQYSAAFRLALTLDQPGRALHALTHVTDDLLRPLVADLARTDLTRCLSWLRQWASEASWPQAQRLLHALLRHYSPSALLALPNTKGVLQALLPYTQRHLRRVHAARQHALLFRLALAPETLAEPPPPAPPPTLKAPRPGKLAAKARAAEGDQPEPGKVKRRRAQPAD